MPESTIKLLSEIGVPVAIIASLIIAIVMRTFEKKVANFAAWVTCISVAVYVFIDLLPKGKDAFFSNTVLTFSPSHSDIQVFKLSGEPTQLSVRAVRGSHILHEQEVPKPSESKINFSPVLLERNENEENDSYYVLRNDFKLGELKGSYLESMGWRKGVIPALQSSFVKNSARVYVGRIWSIGDTSTPLGELELVFLGFKDGMAEISIKSSTQSTPQPKTILINNKGYDTFSFAGNYTVTVLIREANFVSRSNEEWAAFIVIVS